MKDILYTALGTALGSLFYTEVLHKGPSLDWQRALGTAALAGVFAALLNRWKRR